MASKSMNNVVVDVRTLRRDRVGLVVGRHQVAEYKFLQRNNSGHFGYRVLIEAAPGGAFHFFYVERFDEKGSYHVGRMVSFPSLGDCATLYSQQPLRR